VNGKLLLHESARADGSLEPVYLTHGEGELALADDAGVHPLPEGALAAIMRRYAKPLEGALPKSDEELALGEGERLVKFRHKSMFDVIGKDYIAYEVAGEETVAELATAVTAALDHLAKAYAKAK
jgi:hypothetical protein